MRRLVCWALLAGLPAVGGTRIRDTLYYAVSGQTADGQMTISWPSFKSGTRTVVAGRMVLHLVSGVVAADLEANDAAIPAGTSYIVTYQLREGSRSTEYWVVPTSAGVKTISDVRASTIPTPATAINLTQLSQSGATTGQCVGWNGTAWQAVSCATATLATQAEAEAGTENTHTMTPLRTKQATTAQSAPVSHGHAASGVTNTPAGAIAAVTVQAAIDELDSEKSATGHGHAGSAVTNTPAGNVAAVTVQAAIDELDSEKSATGHGHAGAAITNTPAGNIAAVTVQAAIDELDSEKSATGHTHSTANATQIQGRNVASTAPANSQALQWTCTIPSAVFTGSGLNDASSGGTCTADTASLYEIAIDSTAHAWAETRPEGEADHEWYTAASSGDGSKLIVGDYGGRLWVSSNYGTSWTETRPAGNADKYWHTLASSADGSVLLAGIGKNEGSAGRLYLSSNGGASWAETQPAGNADKYWAATAISSDGSYMIAAVGQEFTGRLYTSANGGSSWTERQPAGNEDKYWSAAAISTDGSHMIVSQSTERIWISVNHGVDWAETRPAGDVDRYWSSVSSSADGSKLIACGQNGRVYTSSNGGTNWTERRPAGDVSKFWGSATSSADGSRLVVAVAKEAPGRVYVSSDSGVNWAETMPAGDQSIFWFALASSAGGSHLIIGAHGGRLYTYANPDTFKWRKDGGGWTADVPMTGAAQTLADGVTIAFKATTGHTLGDAWAIQTTVQWAPSTVAGTGDVTAVGDCASGSCYQVATANYVYAGPASGAAAPAALRALVSADLPVSTRQFVFVLGADNGAALVDGDDQEQIWWNNLGSTATITKVGCICDGGTPTVMIQRDDGSAANILSGDLSCTTTGATTTSFVSGENVISDGHKIDFLIQTAGGVAKRLTLTGTYTVTQ